MQVLAFQQLPDVGPDLVQVILHRVELHHGRLEHGLVQLHGVDAVILVLDFHFQTDTFGLQFCNLGRVVHMLYVQCQRERKYHDDNLEVLHYKFLELFHIIIPLKVRMPP